MKPRVAIVQFLGVNCESETARALERVGLEPEVFRWTRPPHELRDAQAFVLPGGFSYQDRVRAGALAAKDPMMEVIAEEAERGKPVLAINACIYWHALRTNGVADHLPDWGSLLAKH